MPELPEVEVTRRRIAPLLVGRRISEVRTTGPSYFFVTEPGGIRRALKGNLVSCLDRRGKYLLVTLEDGRRLLIHLGMTGQLFSSQAVSPRLLSSSAAGSLAPEAQRAFAPDPHTHLQIHFADGGPAVLMRDVRKFGKLILLASGEDHPRIQRLGTDALEADGALIFGASRKRKTAIKALLLDQSVLAGVGNIYADEALFYAGVRPGRRAAALTRRECDALADAVVRVLERSIETGGSSIRDYVAPDGQDGAYQDERRVYARTGQPCTVCGTLIKRKLVAQRGTHYCPKCQR